MQDGAAKVREQMRQKDHKERQKVLTDVFVNNGPLGKSAKQGKGVLSNLLNTTLFNTRISDMTASTAPDMLRMLHSDTD